MRAIKQNAILFGVIATSIVSMASLHAEGASPYAPKMVEHWLDSSPNTDHSDTIMAPSDRPLCSEILSLLDRKSAPLIRRESFNSWLSQRIPSGEWIKIDGSQIKNLPPLPPCRIQGSIKSGELCYSFSSQKLTLENGKNIDLIRASPNDSSRPAHSFILTNSGINKRRFVISSDMSGANLIKVGSNTYFSVVLTRQTSAKSKSTAKSDLVATLEIHRLRDLTPGSTVPDLSIDKACEFDFFLGN